MKQNIPLEFFPSANKSKSLELLYFACKRTSKNPKCVLEDVGNGAPMGSNGLQWEKMGEKNLSDLLVFLYLYLGFILFPNG